ncbi:MAG: hypothetical protein KDC26_07065 [Armatimonadetes bacterium]|nr:hypothetical protein [Armatimonadota bacterium]
MPRLFHFSEEPNIERFVPRSPLAHPDAEALVWAIDEAHSHFYLFPRECPRIGIWDLETGPQGMHLYAQEDWKEQIQATTLYRYEFDPMGFTDCQDHGVWTCDSIIEAIDRVAITDLEGALKEAGARLSYLSDLKAKAEELYNFERKEWKTALHVSMTRMRNLADWPHAKGKPTTPKS